MSHCATENEMSHFSSINFRISASFSLSACAATFFLSFIAVQMVHKQSILPSSTRIILFFNILYANVHQVVYAIESITLVYKGFFLADRPCEVLIPNQSCLPYTYVLFTGISGLTYAQTGLLIERAFATFYQNYTTLVSRRTGITVSFVVFVCSAVTFRIILWDDPLDGYTITCFATPLPSANRNNRFLFICVVLTLFNLGVSMAIMYYNKRLEYEIRFNVNRRFAKRETIDSTHTICVVSMSQFVTMITYSCGALLLRTYVLEVSYPTFQSLIIWVYTLPYSALLLPLILISRIRSTKAYRTQKISDITSTVQTQDEHIEQIQQMWK